MERCQLLLSDSLELLSILAGYGIPNFRATLVHVIDTVHHEILIVPAETGVQHAHVHPRRGHPRYPCLLVSIS